MAGRKSKYDTHVKPRFEEIEKWCKRGATDKEIMQCLGISKNAFYDYKNKYKEFNDLIKNNRIDVVEEIKNALFKRATGFQYDEEKEIRQYIDYPDEVKEYLNELGFNVSKFGKPVLVKTQKTRKFVVPDPTSCLILLKHWDKDNEWTGDPATLKLKKRELKLKEKQAEENSW